MNFSPNSRDTGHILLLIASVGALLTVAGTSLRPSNLTCVNNAATLSLAVSEYTQDYDEHYPPMSNTPAFQTAVLPYARTQSVFVCPVTGAAYKPNAALNYALLYRQGPDPGCVELFLYRQPHADGLPTIGYADGHI